jgi:hypothetical protein
MGKQAAQYEPEDPHYVMSTDSRGKKKRMVVSLVRERREPLEDLDRLLRDGADL